MRGRHSVPAPTPMIKDQSMREVAVQINGNAQGDQTFSVAATQGFEEFFAANSLLVEGANLLVIVRRSSFWLV